MRYGKQLILSFLKKEKIFDTKDGDIAKNEIRRVGNDTILSGNRLGLVLLAEYIIEVALSERSKEHLHLDQSNFFDVAEQEQLIIELTEQ